MDVGHNKMSGTMTFWSCFIVYFCRIVFFFFLNSVDGGHYKVSVTMNFWSCFIHYSCKTCCQNVSFESVAIFSVINFSFSSKLIVTLVRLDIKGVCALNVIDLNNHHRIPKFPSLPFANNRKSGSAN